MQRGVSRIDSEWYTKNHYKPIYTTAFELCAARVLARNQPFFLRHRSGGSRLFRRKNQKKPAHMFRNLVAARTPNQVQRDVLQKHAKLERNEREHKKTIHTHTRKPRAQLHTTNFSIPFRICAACATDCECAQLRGLHSRVAVPREHTNTHTHPVAPLTNTIGSCVVRASFLCACVWLEVYIFLFAGWSICNAGLCHTGPLLPFSFVCIIMRGMRDTHNHAIYAVSLWFGLVFLSVVVKTPPEMTAILEWRASARNRRYYAR